MPGLRIACLGKPTPRRVRVARRWVGAELVQWGTPGGGGMAGWSEPADLPLEVLPSEEFWRQPDRFDALLATRSLRTPEALRLRELCQRYGKHLLLEESVDLSAADYVQGQREFAERGLRFLVANNLRHRPLVASAVAALREGRLGDPGILRVHDWRVGRIPGEDPLNDVPRFAVRSHCDLACWILDETPTAFHSSRPTRQDESSGPEGLVLHLGCPSGAMALIDLTWWLPEGEHYWSLSIIGSRGAAYADEHHNRQLLFQGGFARSVLTDEGDHPLLHLQQTLIDGVTWGTGCVTPAELDRAERLAESFFPAQVPSR